MLSQFSTFSHICIRFFLLFCFGSVCAAPITVSGINDYVLNADFREGEPGKPAVVLLHGFMATNNLNVIQFMAAELESNGYTVLAPTLSLNINNRREGINCEAVHTHTMESDVQEISWWISWLKNKGYKDVVMAGFSTGGLQAAILLSGGDLNVIRKAILVSPAYLAGAPFSQQEEKRDIETAKKMISTRGYTQEVERIKMLEELIREQLANENTLHSTRTSE